MVYLSIKHKPIGKPQKLAGSTLTYDWQSVAISQEALVNHIEKGKPFAVAQFTKGHRRKDHFFSSSILALDIDDSLTGDPLTDDEYAVLLDEQFVTENAFAVIQTFSSKTNARKCRILFELSEVIYDADEYMQIVSLIHEAVPMADPAAKDASRAFFGGQAGRPADFVNYGATLDLAPLRQELAKRAAQQQNQPTPISNHNSQKGNRTWQGELPPGFISAIEQALGAIPSSSNPTRSKNVASPLCHHANDHHEGGSVWNFDKHFLFCFKCGTSYNAVTVGKALGIDIHDYLPKTAAQTQAKPKKQKPLSLAEIVKPYRLSRLKGQAVEEQYISNLPLESLRGMTMIASPTGTGKTELAKKLITEVKEKNKFPRILVVVHRQSLARDTANRYDLPCYLDFDDIRGAPQMVICINSLYKLGLYVEAYDLIIIDELTQVHRHLFGGTFNRGEGIRALSLLEHLTCTAHQVLALDAGMTDIAARWARELRDDVTCINNGYREEKGTSVIYHHHQKVIEKALKYALDGKRIAIGTGFNQSKVLYEIFSALFPGNNCVVINSENSAQPHIQAIINDINNKMPNILIYTPSLGSGIDITAPVDAIFGYFRGNVLPGDDINQMMGRCRNTVERHIYVQPNVDGRLPTNSERIYENYEKKAVFSGINAGAEAPGHLILTERQIHFGRLQSDYEAEDNRSKNNLVSHVVAIMHDSGWITQFAETHAPKELKEELNETSEFIKLQKKHQILNAVPVDESNYRRLSQLKQITLDIQYGHERWKIEKDIAQPLNSELYDRFETTHQREKLRRLTDIRTASPVLQLYDLMETDEPFRDGVTLAKREHSAIFASLVLNLLRFVFKIETVDDLLKYDTKFSAEDIDDDLAEWAGKNLEYIKAYFPKSFFSQQTMLAQLRHILLCVGIKINREQIHTESGDRPYVYSINREELALWIAVSDGILAERSIWYKQPRTDSIFSVTSIQDSEKMKSSLDRARILSRHIPRKELKKLEKVLKNGGDTLMIYIRGVPDALFKVDYVTLRMAMHSI